MVTEVDKTVELAAAARLTRLPARRMLRAHLQAQRHSVCLHELGAGLREVAEALSTAVGCRVDLSARLLGSAFALERHLSMDGVRALVELDSTGEAAVLELEWPVVATLLQRLSGSAGASAPWTR